MNHVIRIIHSLAHWGSWLALIALLTMWFLTCSDIVLRYFGHPIFGSFEIVQFLLALIIGFAVAYTQRSKGHIAIEILVSRFPQRTQAIIDSVNYIFTIGVVSVIIWQCVKLGVHMWKVNQLSMTLRLPLFPVLWAIALAFALFLLVVLADLADALARSIKK